MAHPAHTRRGGSSTAKPYDAALALAGHGRLSGYDPVTPPADVQVVQREVLLERSPQEVFDFCLRGENFAAIMPDRLDVLWMSSTTGELGGTYVFRWWVKGVLPMRWVAHIDTFDSGRQFSDLQLRGLFRYFHHTHTCIPAPAGATLYRDTVRFASLLGPRLDDALLRREMDRTFRKRHQRMRELLGVDAG